MEIDDEVPSDEESVLLAQQREEDKENKDPPKVPPKYKIPKKGKNQVTTSGKPSATSRFHSLRLSILAGLTGERGLLGVRAGARRDQPTCKWGRFWRAVYARLYVISTPITIATSLLVPLPLSL